MSWLMLDDSNAAEHIWLWNWVVQKITMMNFALNEIIMLLLFCCCRGKYSQGNTAFFKRIFVHKNDYSIVLHPHTKCTIYKILDMVMKQVVVRNVAVSRNKYPQIIFFLPKSKKKTHLKRKQSYKLTIQIIYWSENCSYSSSELNWFELSRVLAYHAFQPNIFRYVCFRRKKEHNFPFANFELEP